MSLYKSFFQSTKVLVLSTIMLSTFSSCEEEYIPSTLESEQEIVVEGYVEVGDDANPVFVILTKSIPFISTIEANKFTELFVKDAEVSVFDGDKTTFLTQICLNQIPEPLRTEVYTLLGINADSATVDLCIYVDIFDQIEKEIGRKYDLKIVAEDKTLTASTTVPNFVPLYDFRWDEIPGTPNDTLARLFVKVDDPKSESNFYRYFTAMGQEPLIAPFSSVIEDALFDGQSFEFPLQKAERRGNFNSDSFGFFKRGDTTTIKWCTIDKAHFDFWNTRDFSANSGGPFAAYTRIATNIKGGLGIWGGYAIGKYELEVPPR